MFFILSKLLLFLINPLTWVVTLMILSLVHRGAKVKNISRYSSITLLLIFTNPLLINQVMLSWEPEAIVPDEIPLVTTGIVLGGASEEGKLQTAQIHLNKHAERITEALRLLKGGIIQEIIISGASGSVINNDEREADRLLELAVSLGFSKSVLIVEDSSRNTHENAIYVANILEENGRLDQPVLLITSAFHMPRAKACFEKLGMKVIPYPVDYMSVKYTWSPSWLIPSSEALSNWQMIIKEWIGFFAYQILGYA